MSICSLKALNLQLCRHAFLLARRAPSTQLIPIDVRNRFISNNPNNKYYKMEERRPKVSYNAEVLKAANCNVSRKNLEEKCNEGAKLKDGGDPCSEKDRKKRKQRYMLLALAAALGAAGLGYYFYSQEPPEEPEEICVKKKEEPKPVTSKDLPNHVPYLLIGGGTASFSAFRAIKSNNARAKVLIITNENRYPYMRPPLSKELWYSAKDTELTKELKFKQWTGSERSLYFEPEEFFIEPTKLIESEKGGVAVAQGFTVKKIDPASQTVTLSDGYEISYDECLIATGCRPKQLQIFSNAPPSIRDKVMVYRTPDDFESLKCYIDRKKSVAIIGNGFIGSELACSLSNYSKNNGAHIYQIFPEKGNMSKVLPDYLSNWTMKKMVSQGVCIMANSYVKSATRDDNSIKLNLSTGETVMADVVVVCVGCEANTDLATVSGLEVDKNLGGFVVNAELEARRNLYVAGDASCFYDPLLGRRRVEHHDHSVVSGRLAGENMVGKKKPYTHQSMFWSDLGPEIGYEGIGLVDSSLPTVGVFALPSKNSDRSDNLAETPNNQPHKINISNVNNSSEEPVSNVYTSDYGRGVIFYLKDDKIVGILLWNIFNRIGLARTIINQNKQYDDLNEVAKLFEIHS